MSTRAPAVLIRREPTRVAKCSFVGFREGVCVNYKVLLGKFWVSSAPSPKKTKKTGKMFSGKRCVCGIGRRKRKTRYSLSTGQDLPTRKLILVNLP